jgi:hypothetical protein
MHVLARSMLPVIYPEQSGWVGKHGAKKRQPRLDKRWPRLGIGEYSKSERQNQFKNQ